ncbi:hypothetical protein BN1183_AC_02370 [Pantoea ananatis]|nr:hypothetical protein BN1183_AC_02370 [Pantoea ananatis]
MTRRELWVKIRIKLQNLFWPGTLSGSVFFYLQNEVLRRRTLFSAVTGQDAP